jgi:V8-like Glu-specific endopeptidase
MEGFEAASVEHPEEEDTYSRLLETICGPTDDSQPVEQYDGTLGVTVAFVNAHQAPVGQIQWNDNLASVYNNPGDVSGVRWCSGTLLSNDLFLSAGHCFDQSGGGWQRPLQNGTFNVIPPTEIATNMHVNFNYQVDPSGNLRTEQQFPIVELVEYRLGGLDFAIARLGGSPSTAFGTTQVSTTAAADGEEICIIGHPAGLPKRIEAGTVFHLHDEWIGYDDIDTLGGNSGSGILRESDGRVVGVHTNGGCTSTGNGHNHGVNITSIIAQSPSLQALTAPTLKFIDDGGTLKVADDGGGTVKFADDGGTLKFADDGGTLKFADDGGTLKVADDGGGTLKFADDGGGTLKFLDDGGTLKSVDDVKQPALDKQFGDRKLPGSDAIDPGVPNIRPGLGGRPSAQPFILATPHHSMAWAGARAGATEQAALVARYQEALAQLQQLIQQRMQELGGLDQQFQQALAELQALVSGR